MAGLYRQILNSDQEKLFPQLRFLKKQRFYLAGGTALALHLGHRTSLDFDFYTRRQFGSVALSKEIEKVFGKKAKITLREKETLFCQISKVSFSFFYYQYPLIEKPVDANGVLIAGRKDIAAMKLVSISQRPVKRDYVDLFYLLEIFSLKELFSFVKKKYPNFNQYFALRALTYFEDLEDEGGGRIKIFDKNFSWEKAKKDILEKVKEYQLKMIKK